MARAAVEPINAAPGGAKAPKQKEEKPHYEFFGPPGALCLMLGLPSVLFAMYAACNAHQCVSLNPLGDSFLKVAWDSAWRALHYGQLVDSRAIALFVGWFALHVLLYYVLPGQIVDGVPLDAKGTRLKYPLNGQSESKRRVA